MGGKVSEKNPGVTTIGPLITFAPQRTRVKMIVGRDLEFWNF